MRILRFAPLLIFSLATIGCMTSVRTSIRGVAVMENLPEVGAIRLHPREGSSGPDRGPYVAVYISSPTDLELLARRKEVSWVYYRLFACSSDPSDARLLLGPVFVSSDSESEGISNDIGRSHRYLYIAYIPTDVELIARLASRNIGGDDLDRELEAARKNGFCLVLGGANMMGFGLRSAPVAIPVRWVGNSLVVADDPDDDHGMTGVSTGD